jgi:hypothetical protein
VVGVRDDLQEEEQVTGVLPVLVHDVHKIHFARVVDKAQGLGVLQGRVICVVCLMVGSEGATEVSCWICMYLGSRTHYEL